MKKIKLNTILFSSSIILSSSIATTLASCGCSNNETVGQLVYVETTGGYVVTGLSNKDLTKIKQITIPEKHNNKDVVKINKGAFKGCSNIQQISLPFIGSSKNRNTNANVDSMFGVIFGDEMFDGCSTYTWQFCLNSSKTDVEYAKYAIPTSLTKVTVTNGDSIPSGAFSSCKNIEEVNLSKNIAATEIESFAFYNCSSLESFNFDFNSKIENIGTSAFESCYSLQSIQLNSAVKTLGASAFANCLCATKAYLPKSVSYVGSQCFKNLPSILMLEGSESSTSTWAQDWCDASTSVVYDYTSESYHYKDGYMILTCGTGDNKYGYIAQWMGSWQQQTISIPGSYEVDGKQLPIKVIGSLIFSGNKSLNSLIISEGIEKISSNAFEYCTSLSTVNFPNSLKDIKSNAFIGCTNLKSSLKDGTTINKIFFNKVESIGSKAFYGCSNIRELDLASVKSIGDEAFAFCTHLCPDYTVDENNCLLIPATVTSLGQGAFKWCFKYAPDGVQTTPYYPTIKFGDGTTITEIPDNCFENSGVRVTKPTTGLDAGTIYPTQIRIHVNFNDAPLTRIGDYAFNNMWMGNLKGARHTKLEYIGNYSFYYTQPTSDVSSATGEQSLQIDQECKYIGDYAFAYCTTIKELKFLTADDEGHEKGYNSLEHLGQYAFYGCSNQDFWELDLSKCTKLRNITNGESEGTYDASNTPRYAFAQCTNLISVKLPDQSALAKPTFTRLPERMFEGCTKLGMAGSITIPSNITDIRACAFNGCQYLKNAYIDGTIQYYGSSIFNNNYKLETVTKTGGQPVKFADNILRENIGSNQYYNCYCLTNAPIPYPAVMPANYYYNIPSSAYYNCRSLTSMDYSNQNIYAVGSYAFFGCTGLTDFKFSTLRQTTSIGEKAFAGCKNLGKSGHDFVLPAQTIYMGAKVFEDWDSANQKVYFNLTNVKNYASWDQHSNFTLRGTDTWTFVYHQDATKDYWTCSSCGTDNLKFYLKQ